MQSKSQGAPARHHFIPEFLLRRWTGPDGLLLRYRRSERGIVARRAAPKSVCFESGLYTTEGFPPEHEQQMETLFMGPVDSEAARAHAHLVERGTGGFSDAHRVSWARFVMSLWFRTPRDVNHLWDAVSALAEAAPERLPAVAVKQLQMEALRKVIDDKERGEELLNMEWSVLDVTNRRELWISDWPMDLPSGAPWLGSRSSYVTVPLSPSRLFVAAGSVGLSRAIAALPQRELVMRQNRATVRHALNFVGATDDLAADFIVANFGTLERPSIMRGIAERYRGGAAP